MSSNIYMHIYNPDLYVNANNVGVDGDIFIAESDFIQFNLNTPSMGGAIFVNGDNNGIISAKLDVGYEFVDGLARIDRNNVFTRNQDQSGGNFSKDAILDWSTIYFKIDEQDRSKSLFHVMYGHKSGGVNGVAIGTINVRFIYKYRKAQ